MKLTCSCLLHLSLLTIGAEWAVARLIDFNGLGDMTRGDDTGTFFGKGWMGRKGMYRRKRAMPIKNTAGSGRWPGGIIPYQMANDFTSEEKTKILAAMQEYMKYSCVQFKNRMATNMIRIQNSNACHAPIGMVGGVQKVGLGTGCRSKDTVMHELGHALGLIHEHQRPDRDQYITVNTHNVKADRKTQFRKYSWGEVENLGVPFDYEGIMEYGTDPFSSNGEKTIISKQKGAFLGPVRMDEYVHLTYGDAKAINLMYPCTTKCPNASKCSRGFLGNDCKCWCPPKLNGMTYDNC